MGRAEVRIGEAADVFQEFMRPSRYKALYGGRGSAKSHFFAECLIANAHSNKGFRAACVREVQKDLKESAKLLLEDKIRKFGLTDSFRVLNTEIITPGDGVIIFKGMRDYTADSVKSLEGFNVAWLEEAQTISAKSWEMLRPTIRTPGSEIWASWNPRTENDPIDKFFRGVSPPENAVIRQINYDQNKFFPAELEEERKHDEKTNPDRYRHIWLGEYEPAAIGAYYGKQLIDAGAENRITSVPWEPSMPVHTAWDLGIGDSTAVWFLQEVGMETRVIDFYENSSVGLEHYANELRSKPYVYGNHYLPHDAQVRELGTGRSRVETLQNFGIRATVVPAQSVDDGINAVRLLLPKCWFDKQKTEKGLEALRQYRAEYDEKRQTLKPRPVHDWTSHAADALRYYAMGHRNTKKRTAKAAGGGWMG